MSGTIEDLPIYRSLDSIADALFSSPSRFLVLTAETAAGKSTAVPIALLPRVRGSIVMLEPRRIATVAVASRIAELLGEAPGRTAGYRLHLDSLVSRDTRIEVITEAILTRRLQGDPSLAGVSVVILDEFHERSVHSDLALAFLKESMSLRDDLFVLVMSATIDTERLSAYLGSPVMSVPGRRFPVEIEYAPAEIRRDGKQTPLEELAANACKSEIARRGDSGILVFLPGIAEIRRTERLIADCGVESLVLHSSIFLEEQKRALSEPKAGQRRIILSSSIAETSLTVPGVTTVIDSGLARFSRVDARTGMDTLETGLESVFSAEQRAGRAGRLGPGRCVRLWAERDVRVADQAPEILRTDLLAVVLECALWGVSDIDGLSWLSRPSDAAWGQARELLAEMGALDGSGRITPRGKAMASLGTHPRLAAVALDGGFEYAVQYSERSRTTREAERFGRDLESRLARARKTLAHGGNEGRYPPGSPMTLLSGFPDRIALHAGDGLYRFPSGRVAALPRDARADTARYPKWIVAPEVDSGDREGRIRAFEALDETLAESWLEPRAKVETTISFADGKLSSVAKIRKTETRAYGKIVLSERRVEASPDDAIAATIDAIKRAGLSILPWTQEAESFLLRARFRERAKGRLENPPIARAALSDESLIESLDSWLVPFIPSSGGIDGHTLLDALRYRADGQSVDRDVPARITLANGVSRPLAFEELAPGEGPIPILEIRIQDLFGCPDTPRVLGMPVLLRLLSPARRPLQVTSDLAGFWKNTWPEVRKEMKGRYPKHKWPEDPFARDTAKG